jgi:hypothetical protein
MAGADNWSAAIRGLILFYLFLPLEHIYNFLFDGQIDFLDWLHPEFLDDTLYETLWGASWICGPHAAPFYLIKFLFIGTWTKLRNSIINYQKKHESKEEHNKIIRELNKSVSGLNNVAYNWKFEHNLNDKLFLNLVEEDKKNLKTNIEQSYKKSNINFTKELFNFNLNNHFKHYGEFITQVGADGNPIDPGNQTIYFKIKPIIEKYKSDHIIYQKSILNYLDYIDRLKLVEQTGKQMKGGGFVDYLVKKGIDSKSYDQNFFDTYDGFEEKYFDSMNDYLHQIGKGIQKSKTFKDQHFLSPPPPSQPKMEFKDSWETMASFIPTALVKGASKLFSTDIIFDGILSTIIAILDKFISNPISVTYGYVMSKDIFLNLNTIGILGGVVSGVAGFTIIGALSLSATHISLAYMGGISLGILGAAAGSNIQNLSQLEKLDYMEKIFKDGLIAFFTALLMLVGVKDDAELNKVNTMTDSSIAHVKKRKEKNKHIEGRQPTLFESGIMDVDMKVDEDNLSPEVVEKLRLKKIQEVHDFYHKYISKIPVVQQRIKNNDKFAEKLKQAIEGLNIDQQDTRRINDCYSYFEQLFGSNSTVGLPQFPEMANVGNITSPITQETDIYILLNFTQFNTPPDLYRNDIDIDNIVNTKFINIRYEEEYENIRKAVRLRLIEFILYKKALSTPNDLFKASLIKEIDFTVAPTPSSGNTDDPAPPIYNTVIPAPPKHNFKIDDVIDTTTGLNYELLNDEIIKWKNEVHAKANAEAWAKARDNMPQGPMASRPDVKLYVSSLNDKEKIELKKSIDNYYKLKQKDIKKKILKLDEINAKFKPTNFVIDQNTIRQIYNEISFDQRPPKGGGKTNVSRKDRKSHKMRKSDKKRKSHKRRKSHKKRKLHKNIR